MKKSNYLKGVHSIKDVARMLSKLPVKWIALLLLMILLIISVIIEGAIAGSDDTANNDSYGSYITGGFPPAVEAYRTLIESLCEEYNTQPEKLNLTDYVNVALAFIQIETNGNGTDPMQASECNYNTEYANSPNAIKDAEYSCRCGVQYMRDALIKFEVKNAEDYDKLAAAAQGYNFGIDGWYSWIKEKNNCQYTVAFAQEYSRDKMPANAKGTPTHGQKFLAAYTAGIANGVNGNRGTTLDNIVYYCQWDSRWAAYPYGAGTIQSSGCGITCMAMVVASLCNNNVAPPAMADLSIKNNGYIKGQGSSMPVVVASASRLYGLSYQSISISDIPSYISNKHAYIIWGCHTGYFSSSSAGHVMIIRGVDDEGNFLLADPNRQENNTKSFSPDFIAKESKGYYIAVWKEE